MELEKIIDCNHAVKCLHTAGIMTKEQLSSVSAEELFKIKGIGKKTAAYLTAIIEQAHDTVMEKK